MKLVTKIRMVAVLLIALSWSLGRYSNPVWLWLSALIGVNVLQSAFTGFTPVETFFKAITKSKRSASID